MTRFLFVYPDHVLDSGTGEISERPTLEQLLLTRPGGIIAGRNLYPMLAPMVNESRKDEGWTTQVHKQQQRMSGNHLGGVLYFTRLSYRFPKVRYLGHRYRPGSIKWLILNLELFTESTDIEDAARALVHLAERRGISPRHSPGAFGGAMLRASREWSKDRRPAPWFISDAARPELPGNFYVLRHRYTYAERGYYIDQQSSHHSIAAKVPLPHPHYLRARGLYRSAGNGRTPKWLDGASVGLLDGHTGLVRAVIETSTVAPAERHLFPPWALTPGRKAVWLWTPELRLLDTRMRLCWFVSAFTAKRRDPVLSEYAQWSLDELAQKPHSVVKPALLAAYGVLAVRKRPLQRYSVHGRAKPPRAEVCRLPMLDTVYRSTIDRVRVSPLQNVIARGVIEAEVRTRSIEYARRLEGEGVPVVQIYADGLIAAVDQLPFIPDGWHVQAALTGITAPSPNSIRSRELVRLPGIPNGRRTMLLKPSFGPRHTFGSRPAVPDAA